MAALAAARDAVAKSAKPEDLAAARAAVDECVKNVKAGADAFAVQAEELAKTAKGSEAHLRILYESAWCYRAIADAEAQTAIGKAQKEAVDKVLARMMKDLPAGTSPPSLRPPEIPLSDVPVQPAEELVAGQYAKLLAAAPDEPLVNQARFELAELHALRTHYDAALTLLADCLERNPSPDMAERIRLRLASCLLAMGDAKSALVQLQAVARNPRTLYAVELRGMLGEAYITQKDWGKAIEQLSAFRDQPPLAQLGGSDRSVMRLAYALAQSSQWDAARATLEAFVQRYPTSRYIEEAYLNLGQAWQNLKQFDNAAANYAETVKRSASVFAAKAQLQIGLCRMEQKNYAEAVKALLVVPYAYDYPELNAPALCEAGRAHAELKQPAEAAKCYQRVVKEYAASDWAKVAQQALAGLK